MIKSIIKISRIAINLKTGSSRKGLFWNTKKHEISDKETSHNSEDLLEGNYNKRGIVRT
jgi:hypothetical protein